MLKSHPKAQKFMAKVSDVILTGMLLNLKFFNPSIHYCLLLTQLKPLTIKGKAVDLTAF